MSILLRADDFDNAGALAAPWGVATGGTWTVVGGRLRVDGTPNTFRRAVHLGSSPWPQVTGSSTQADPKRIEVETQITTPAVYSATQDAYAGVCFWANSANSTLAMIEGYWTYRPSLAVHQVHADVRSAAGVRSNLFSFSSANITTPAAGTTHKLTMRITYYEPAFARVEMLWDDVLTTGGIFLTLYPTLGFGATPGIGSFYAGLVASVPGPADTAGNPANPLYFEAFRVRDWGAAAQFDELFPQPAAVGFPSLTHTTVEDEIVASGVALDIAPDYVISHEEDWPGHSVEFDGGYTDTTARTTRTRRRWSWTWQALTSAERTTLLSRFTSARGSARSVTWTWPETGESIVVAMVPSTFYFRRIGMDVFECQMTVEELHA